jgi:hypothetical protein
MRQHMVGIYDLVKVINVQISHLGRIYFGRFMQQNLANCNHISFQRLRVCNAEIMLVVGSKSDKK